MPMAIAQKEGGARATTFTHPSEGSSTTDHPLRTMMTRLTRAQKTTNERNHLRETNSPNARAIWCLNINEEDDKHDQPQQPQSQIATKKMEPKPNYTESRVTPSRPIQKAKHGTDTGKGLTTRPNHPTGRDERNLRSNASREDSTP